ncbi:MAG TPA: hypothetical protein PKK94_18490, partial [Leptospiraceae bacterium]|nr:hypothetical protein [Leptospiraceae bacterium]
IDMNTLETYDALKKVNFTEEQSRELVRFFGKTLEADSASRRDLSETELRLQKEIAEIRKETEEIRKETEEIRKETEGIRLEIQDVRLEIQDVRLEIKNVEMKLSKEIEGTRLEIKNVESRILETVSSSKVEILKWVAGMLIANTGLIVALSRILK